jgi:exopolyphosphatase/guanosine-5'-triphosphate,3'-diphosphate pyrophosphatase
VRQGCDLSGRNPRLLEKSGLALKGDNLALTAARGWEDMLLGEQTTKRAQTLAGILKLKLEVG